LTGRLIAFEGADASGKSTQARLFAEQIGGLLTFEFGATRIGDAIRRILLDTDHQEFDDRAEALLIIADKAQHVAEVVGPALADGLTVVTDRFTASALAYQGYGRGIDLEMLRSVMQFATHGLRADLTVLLDVDAAVARERLGSEIDRIEGAGAEFHQRVRDGYLELAAAEPDRWVVVDAAGTVDEVSQRVRASVDEWQGRS